MSNKNEKKTDTDIDTLNINEDYAKKFKYNKQRQQIEKAKALGKTYSNKYKNNNENDKSYSESSSDSEEGISEDSEGELDTEIVRDKFIETLAKLHSKEETKKLIENKTPIFTEDDFKEKRKKKNNTSSSTSQNKPYTINDALLMKDKDNDENVDENINPEDDIYSIHYKPKTITVSQEEKKAFINKANEDLLTKGNNNENDGNDDDAFFDDGFLVKKKTQTKNDNTSSNENNANNDNENDDQLSVHNLESMTLDEVLSKSKIKTKNINMQLVRQMWDDSKLSKTDKFLRNYVMSEVWLDNKSNNEMNKHFLRIDKEDEENEDKFDDFENKFNHRFEEEGGANITTYQRNIDSYRHKDDSRIKKRKERELRKVENEEKIKSEIKEAKLAKAEEIKKKLNKLERIAGTEKIAQIANEFENEEDFDMDKFDAKMNEVFNDEYYNKQLNEEEIERFEPKEEENKEENDDDNNNEYNEEPLWFFCDNCKHPLKPGKIKYECKTCDDFTLCKTCYKSQNHVHPMKKTKVSIENAPPLNAVELIQQHISQNELICSKCNKEIITNYYFICNEETCMSLKFCKTCRGIGKSIHEHKLHKYILPVDETQNDDEEEKEIDPKLKLTKLIENNADTAIDMVIDKEIPSKFHYTKVNKDSSELTNEMILLLDDKVLNKYLPIKKIAPYVDYKLPDYKRKAMLKHLEKALDKKKKELREEYEKNEKISKDNEKFTQKKKKRNKSTSNAGNNEGYLNKGDYKYKKRLETYGITE